MTALMDRGDTEGAARPLGRSTSPRHSGAWRVRWGQRTVEAVGVAHSPSRSDRGGAQWQGSGRWGARRTRAGGRGGAGRGGGGLGSRARGAPRFRTRGARIVQIRGITNRSPEVHKTEPPTQVQFIVNTRNSSEQLRRALAVQLGEVVGVEERACHPVHYHARRRRLPPPPPSGFCHLSSIARPP